MTLAEADAIGDLALRLRHVAATAAVVGAHERLDPDVSGALGNIEATLEELAERLYRVAKVTTPPTDN